MAGIGQHPAKGPGPEHHRAGQPHDQRQRPAGGVAVGFICDGDAIGGYGRHGRLLIGSALCWALKYAMGLARVKQKIYLLITFDFDMEHLRPWP